MRAGRRERGGKWGKGTVRCAGKGEGRRGGKGSGLWKGRGIKVGVTDAPEAWGFGIHLELTTTSSLSSEIHLPARTQVSEVGKGWV